MREMKQVPQCEKIYYNNKNRQIGKNSPDKNLKSKNKK